MPIPCGTGFDIITPNEREALGRLASSGAASEWGDAGRASDILKAVNEGVLPPPESVEWFVKRFRSALDNRITCSWCRELMVPGSGHSCQEQDDWDDNEDARG